MFGGRRVSVEMPGAAMGLEETSCYVKEAPEARCESDLWIFLVAATVCMLHLEQLDHQYKNTDIIILVERCKC